MTPRPDPPRPESNSRDSTPTSAIVSLYVAERHDASGLAISRGGTGVRGRSSAGSRRHPRIEAALSGAKGRAAEADVAQPRCRTAATNVGHIEPAGWYRIIYPCSLVAPRRSITPRDERVLSLCNVKRARCTEAPGVFHQQPPFDGPMMCETNA